MNLKRECVLKLLGVVFSLAYSCGYICFSNIQINGDLKNNEVKRKEMVKGIEWNYLEKRRKPV